MGEEEGPRPGPSLTRWSPLGAVRSLWFGLCGLAVVEAAQHSPAGPHGGHKAGAATVTSTGKDSLWGARGAAGTQLGSCCRSVWGRCPPGPAQDQHEPRPGGSRCRGNKAPREPVRMCQNRLYSSGGTSAQPRLLTRSREARPAAALFPQLCTQSPAASHRWAPPAHNSGTRGGGTVSSSCSPGGSHTTHVLLRWAPGGQEREGLRPGKYIGRGPDLWL